MTTLTAGSEFLVNEYTDGYQGDSSVTALADGGFVVTWTSEDGQQGDDGYAVKARVFDAEGQEVVSEFLVSGGNRPSITALPDGGFVVTWTSYDGQQGDASYGAIKARIFTFSNRSPEAQKDLVSVFEDQTTAGDVLLNDADLDVGDTLSVVAVNGEAEGVGQAVQGEWGTLVLNAEGGYTYAADGDRVDTLDAGETREDVFAYTVSDGRDGSDTTTLTVTVTAIDDAETVRLGNGKNAYVAGPVSVEIDGETIEGDGDQTIFGGKGKDDIQAGGGADEVHGGNGKDRLDGGDGIDTLRGGRGDDWLTGGEGADTLVFAKAGGDDTVTDFDVDEDMILLDGVDLRHASARDVDGNGTLDTVLRLSSGSVTLLDTDITDHIASNPDDVFLA